LIEAGQVTLSVASFWEVVIKTRKRQLTIADPVSWWNRASDGLGARVLPIRPAHVSVLWGLPELHKDPFDRILIAQSTAEGLPLVTGDRQIAAYPVRVLW
jgi:PIN domain nuclease of toxin-antitoxin system